MNKASQSYINAAREFENIERILLYLKVSDYLINEDLFKSVGKLKIFNENLEIPFELNSKREIDFLKINNYETTLSPIMYIRTIDNFESYFKEILSEIVISDPRILKSKETERLDFILSFDNNRDMINAIAEKKIEQLFYHGIDDIKKYFSDKINVDIFQDKADQIDLLLKQRNLAVHNRSKVSKEFIKQFPKELFVDGEYLHFTFDYVEKIISALYKIVNDLDNTFTKKYNLCKVIF